MNSQPTVFSREAADDSQLSYEQLRMILDNSYDEIYVFNGDGVIIYANEACERNYDLKVKDIIGKTIYDCYREYDYHPFLSPIVLHERKRITLEHMSNTGKKLVVTATPVLDNLGQVEMVIMNTRDIDQLTMIKHDISECQKLSDLYYLDSGISDEESDCLNRRISKSDAFLRCVETSKQVAPTNANILILGETGTGKTLMAKFIHQNSSMEDGPFFTINCAAIPEYLLESELFGHKKGAYTGATADKEGIFDLARHGTLFLDEIAEIPMHIQAKLLQAIQDKSFLPVGGTSFHQLEARIVSSTNKNLLEEVKKGNFRSDLYYRLNVIEIYMPPLRERYGDISNLARFFLDGFNNQYKTYHTIDNSCLEILEQYSWPGNIRQLQNFMERLVLMVQEERIMPEHLPSAMLDDANGVAENQENLCPAANISVSANSLSATLAETEKQQILVAYQEYGSSRKVAQALGISQSKASRLIRKYINMGV